MTSLPFELSLWELGAAGGAIFLGAGLQAAVGFGIGLVVVPLLVAAGFALPHAVGVLLGAGTIQMLLALSGTRSEIQPRLSLGVGLAQAVGVPLGVGLMGLLVATDPATVRRAVGGALIVIVTARLLLKPSPKPDLSPFWGALAGVCGGFLAGLVGMGGPPLVLYALARGWSKERFRAFMWGQFLLGVPVVGALLAWRFGARVGVYMLLGGACAPLAWLATKASLGLTRQWKLQQLQRGATVVLYLLGLSAIVT